MELHIKDRIYIPQMLPQQNNFMGFNLKREIIKTVGLTEAVKETYNNEEDTKNSRITWDITKDELNYLKNACETPAEANYPDDFWMTVEKIYNEAQG